MAKTYTLEEIEVELIAANFRQELISTLEEINSKPREIKSLEQICKEVASLNNYIYRQRQEDTRQGNEFLKFIEKY